MNKLRTAACAVAVGATTVALAAAPASAAKVKTHVVVTQGGNPVSSPVALASPSPLSSTVDVGLDGNCLQALQNHQTYGIAASTDNSAVATVSPASYNSMQCGDTHPFVITAVGDGSATIRF